MKFIPVFKSGQVVAHALVDDEVYDNMSQSKWYLGSYGYAVGWYRADKVLTSLQRAAVGAQSGEVVTFANHNRLDCRRENLVIMTTHEIAKIRGANGGRKSRGGGFTGRPELAKRAGRLGGLKSKGQPHRSHCKRGHELSGDNVYHYGSPGKRQRQCRACMQVRKEQRRMAA